MRVTVLYFAQARERAGCASEPLELPDGSRVAEARAALVRAHPALEPLWPHLALAVDGQLVSDAKPLAEGAELALLPPVSGG
jgi:molybdopterin converting factor subunit 1